MSRRLAALVAAFALASCMPAKPVELSAVECDALSGAAPFKTRCTVHLGAEATASWCSFSISNGTVTPAQRSPCTDAEVEVRLPATGKSELVVTAMREAEATDSRSVALEALNGPPSVAELTASPAAGPAPLVTRVSWSVTDPNLDALSCEVKVDGVRERSILDCRSTTDLELTLPLGAHELALDVRDVAGATANATLQLNAERPVGDFKLERAELGQTFFGDAGELIAGKDTMVRGLATAPSPGLIASGAVSVQLADGGVVGLPLKAPKTVPTKVITGTLQSAFWAVIPGEYIEPGVSVEVKLARPEMLIDPNPANERAVLTPAVRAGRTLQVSWVPIDFDGVTAQVQNVDARLRNMFPVRDIASNIRAPYVFSGSFEPDPYGGWGDLLSDMWTLRQADASNDIYFASIDTGKGGDIAGMAWLGSPVASGLSFSADYVAPHELGHSLDLFHAPCGVYGDGSYPYPLAAIGVDGIILFDGNPAIAPSAWKDFMSYCAPKWISDYNFNKLRTFIESQSFSKPLTATPVALIRGTLRKGRLSLQPVHRLTAPATPAAEQGAQLVVEGDWKLSLRVELHRETDGGDGLHFVALVPDPGHIRRVTVRSRDAEWTVEASPATSATADAELSEQSGVAVLQWNARLHPTAALRHLAPDGHRTTLALGLRGGRASIPVARLPSGGVYELSLSDGLNAVRSVFPRR